MVERGGRAAPADVRDGGAQERSGSVLRIRVLFFARFRELAGTSRAEVEVPAGSTVEELLGVLRRRPGLQFLPGRPAVAVNLEYAPVERRLLDGDEVALIPPVAGGRDFLEAGRAR